MYVKNKESVKLYQAITYKVLKLKMLWVLTVLK